MHVMPALSAGHDRRVYYLLIQGFDQSGGQQHEKRWQWLEAAHVVGQATFTLHVHSHVTMLRLAWKTRDYGEAAGQLFRLAMVPLGHLFNRLPAGNTGRATVSAFTSMAIDPTLKDLISQTSCRATN